MRIENGIKVRNNHNSRVPTKVVNFRAEPSVLQMCQKCCEDNGFGMSELILRALTEYCNKNEKRE